MEAVDVGLLFLLISLYTCPSSNRVGGDEGSFDLLTNMFTQLCYQLMTGILKPLKC